MDSDTGTGSRDAFAALGNDLRLAVLRVLAAAMEADGSGLSFTALYDELGIESTSRLAYHLSKLDGWFVQRRDDEYVLTQAGDRVVRAVRSGTYSERPSFERTTLEGDCPRCESTTLVAAYEAAMLVVACEACDATVVRYDLPPAAARDRTSREVLADCNRRAHSEYENALRGTCSTCGGRTEVAVESSDGGEYACVSECSQCGLRLFAPFEARVLYHPGVVSFYWARGVDVSNYPFWRLHSLVSEWTVEGLDEDGLPCRVVLSCEGDSLRAVVDENLAVSVEAADAVAGRPNP
ncbi:DUF7351 domain-containing protein [Halobacterium yunchengense]|uniref:DUF7351 domain-containing protein n=1 Tax=Halobacterium yunchengense TaxID=3108497 RepID=UPI00300BD345